VPLVDELAHGLESRVLNAVVAGNVCQVIVRGIRFNLVQAGATTVEMLEPLSKRVNDLGWHVQLNLRPELLVQLEDLLLRSPSPLVFDHLAHIPRDNGVEHPAFKTMLKLIDKGHTWVKLSGAYQDATIGAPTYADATPIAQAYVKAAPERMVWGSDWPHPTEKDKPDDAILFDLLSRWVPDEGTRNRILVQNPEGLYGFGSA
jgi:D-galactarolactone isomerase